MKRLIGFGLISILFAVAPAIAQTSYNHGEVGVFADYYRYTDYGPDSNFLGLGGRAGFNLHPNVQIEAEMAYDFERNYTSTFTNGITTSTVNTKLRTLHGFFGPKFQADLGPIRLFATGKVGFDNFNVTNQGAPTGFASSVGLTSGATYFAVYPAAGIEFFGGPFGVRVEAGDDVFFNNGGHNNLRVTFGPQFRF